jgi:hypothetical protein
MRKAAKTVLPALLIILIFLGFYLYTAEGSVQGPTQPILFSHKIHAGDNQIPCAYCHAYTAVSPSAGIPSVQKCLGCHNQVAGRDVEYQYDGKTINIQKEIQKLKEYGNSGVPIPWVRVHYLPDHVHFLHSRHIQRGFECKACHGEVQKMDVVHRVHDLKMGWCINCHEANAKNKIEVAQLKDCFTCHY